MAKKKVTTTVEETEEAPIDPIQKMADERASKFLGETVVNNEVVEEPKEEVKEEIKEEVVETPPAEETETVEFDPEQLKREAAAEARKEILAALAGNTEEKTQENVDEYAKFQQSIWDKEKRQPTWTEAAGFIKEQAKAELKAEQEAARKEQEDLTKKQQEEVTKYNESVNKYVEEAFNELYTANKLPRIQDKDNPDDYGARVKKEFYNTIVKVNAKRVADGVTPKTVKEIFYEDFKMPAKQVAGYDAPVNMGRGGYTPDTDNEQLDYRKDIQNKSIRQIMMGAFKKS